MIYILVFIICIFLCIIGQKTERVIWIIISGVLLIALASLRDGSVGIDTNGYMRLLYDYAEYYNNLVQFVKMMWTEPLYTVLPYIAKKIFDSRQALYFLSELLVISFTLAAIWRQRHCINIGVAVMMYLTVFYLQTFNTIRQQIAMSIILLGYTFYIEGKKFVFYFLIAFAFGFHTTAIVALFIPIIKYYAYTRYARKYLGVVISGILVLAIFYDKIFILVVKNLYFLKSAFVSSEYLYNKFYLMGKINLPLTDLCFWGVLLLICIINYLNKKEDSVFWLLIGIICMLDPIIAIKASHVKRIFWYFEICSILNYSSSYVYPVKYDRNNIIIYKSFLAVLFFLYFCIMYIYLSSTSAGAYPYVFYWDGMNSK